MHVWYTLVPNKTNQLLANSKCICYSKSVGGIDVLDINTLSITKVYICYSLSYSDLCQWPYDLDVELATHPSLKCKQGTIC